jgi:hypothetical protein
MIDAIEKMAKGSVPYFVWMKNHTPVFRLALNGEKGEAMFGGLFFSIVVILYWWLSGAVPWNEKSALFTMMHGAACGYFIALMTIYPIIEILFIVPLHWWRRRKAKKEGKDSYESFGHIGCRYTVERTFLVWLKRNTLMFRLLFNRFRSFVVIVCLALVINESLWIWSFSEIPDFSRMFVRSWIQILVGLLIAFEVLFVLPTHWWRRRKAKKEGKDSYKSVNFIKCKYPV